MLHQSAKPIFLGIFVALLLLTMPVYAVKNFKISNYRGGHQIWFEAEDYDERNPDTEQFYPVVDKNGAFGRAINRLGGTGGMMRWTFDISAAGGKGGTWYFWGRVLNPDGQSDYMLVEGDPGDAEIPTGPPFPGGDGEPPFVNEDDRIFEGSVPAWGWWGQQEGGTKKLQNGENTMYIFHRQGNNTVFWDVFMWADRMSYEPTDEDYRNALMFVPSTASNPSPANGAVIQDTWARLTWTPGAFAASHDVYFGEHSDDVDAGTGGTFQGNQPSNDFLVGLPGYPYPDGLVSDTTYFWRVDEVEADGVTKRKGRIWSFFVPSIKPDPSAVPTFHCIGVYWSPQDSRSGDVCQVRYRAHGSTGWKEALPLWYDDRGIGGYPAGYRGSIVSLNPGTVYEIKLKLLRTGTEAELIAETWSEDFPIAQTVYLPAGTTNETLEITESGSPDGYILYTASSGGSVIDVRHNQDYCITVNASYVIIRGLNLKGARDYGIRLYDCHDVVIEQCDISDFSSIEDDGWGNRGAAIFSHSVKLERIIVQRNKIHRPYSDTNSWSEYRAKYGSYHPRGPRAVGFVRSAGNHVIRYNEIYSDDDHYFADCLTAGNNNFPNRDSDIYGNYIANCWDDGIEAEDDNCNVRIWGNFIEWTFVKIAVAPTNVGPVYIWRNVAGVGRKNDIEPWNEVERGGFLKTSDIDGGGKIYVFHNTLLQPEQPRGVYYPLGSGRGLGWGGPMLNTMSLNNILHICNPSGSSIHDRNYDPLGSYDYDLFNGKINAYPGAEPNGIRGVPINDRNNGDGEFALDPSSPGYDAGVVIPNFNDDYTGAAPDIGAFEAGSPPMEFGVEAYQ